MSEEFQQNAVASKSCPQMSSVEKEKNSAAQKTSYRCFSCQETFLDYSEYMTHKKRLKPNKMTTPPRCEYCGKEFARNALVDHMDAHIHNQLYGFDVSFRKFLLKKQQIQTDEMYLTCEFCNKSFSSRNSLKHHQRRHISEEKYLCHVCLEKFHDEWSLERHIKNHVDNLNTPLKENVHFDSMKLRI